MIFIKIRHELLVGESRVLMVHKFAANVTRISFYRVGYHSSTGACRSILVIKSKAMLKRNKVNSSAGNKRLLETEYPLCEKDEQARTLEHIKQLQKEALKLWRAKKRK